MNITLVSHHPVPPLNYGGTERVVWYLGQELTALGHRVTFLAGKGTRSDWARVVEIDPSRPLASQIPDDTDIVHFQDNVPTGVVQPYVVTVHGNNRGPQDLNTIFVSQDHAQRYNSRSFVHNGLNWADYSKPQFDGRRSYFHFLGKASWKVKNVRGAIQIVEATPAERLRVLGGYRLNLKSGFRLTTSLRTRFHGMVNGAHKDALLQGSKGLIFPVLWHEPFGLALIESLYFGCPVFATPVGAIPEIVKPEFGFLSSDLNEVATAIQASDGYDRRRCSEYACEEFNSKKMASAYLSKYEQVLNGTTLNEKQPELTIDRYDGIRILPINKHQ